MFCTAVIAGDQLHRLGIENATIQRYNRKQWNEMQFKCQARCRGIYTRPQDFSREKDGRVFSCKRCKFQTCVDCDRPEHVGETCEEYQARVRSDPVHKEAEAATRAAFRSCPKCETLFDVDQGCGYVQCAPSKDMTKNMVVGGCGHRFCGTCMINWVGDASFCLAGQSQHGTDQDGKVCKYFYVAEKQGDNGLRHRFEPSEAEEPGELRKKRKWAEVAELGDEDDESRGKAAKIGALPRKRKRAHMVEPGGEGDESNGEAAKPEGLRKKRRAEMPESEGEGNENSGEVLEALRDPERWCYL